MINWEPKGENILKIAKKFNINTNAMLFIDDNIAELENTKITGVKTLLCDENILYKIKLFPNLLKLSNYQRRSNSCQRYSSQCFKRRA